MKIRSILPADTWTLLQLIKELALIHWKKHEVIVDEKEMMHEIKDWKWIHWIIAEENEEVCGMILYNKWFSSWRWRAYFIDDFYVLEKYRRRWVGKTLFDSLIKQCKSENIRRISWYYSKHNTIAEHFYKNYIHEVDSELVFCSYII